MMVVIFSSVGFSVFDSESSVEKIGVTIEVSSFGGKEVVSTFGIAVLAFIGMVVSILVEGVNFITHCLEIFSAIYPPGHFVKHS